MKPTILKLKSSLVWILALACCACSSLEQKYCADCQSLQLNQTNFIALNALANPQLAQSQQGSPLTNVHVYFEGDGKAWLFNRPPKNPTTTIYLALQLMQLDSAPAVYLQRPCYGYKKIPALCAQSYWTNARYSEQVIAQINSAMDELKRTYAIRSWVLVGHSGGGSLAMLVAAKRQDINAVVTIAANLDHQQWTQSFHYAPLTESLNAVDVELAPDILRWHFAGSDDLRVPAEMTQAAAKRDPYAEFYKEDGYDHSCCWQELWPQVLERLQQALTDSKN